MNQKGLPGRRCAICGRIGGSGATLALRFVGIRTPAGEIGYAHGPCLTRLQKVRDEHIIEKEKAR